MIVTLTITTKSLLYLYANWRLFLGKDSFPARKSFSDLICIESIFLCFRLFDTIMKLGAVLF